ncbi:MAG: transposase [Planctomycetaceae bacterium]
MNRGIARRPIFEREQDHRYFESRIAQAVRRGQIEVHAYSALQTHFHMLVRSPHGVLSDAMRRIQNEYVRYFNRLNRRDGSLMRSRFRSRRVDSIEYRRMVVRYIDDNAVESCMARDASHYPFCSAAFLATGETRPWLSRYWVEEECGMVQIAQGSTHEAYFSRFPTRLPEGYREWVERRIICDSALFDELTPLMTATPAEIQDWMRRKALLADGTAPGLPVLPTPVLLASYEEHRARECPLRGDGPWGRLGPWPLLEAGLLRELCSLSLPAIATLLRRPRSTAQEWAARHRTCLLQHAPYARVAESITRLALDAVRRQ